MFTPQDLVAEIKARPFEPFRIQMSDGSSFDVLHPDQAMVTRGHLIVGLPPEASENGGWFDTTVKLSILHITELRPIQRRRPRKPSRGSA